MKIPSFLGLLIALGLISASAYSQATITVPPAWDCNDPDSPFHVVHTTAACGAFCQSFQPLKSCSIQVAPHFGAHNGSSGNKGSCSQVGRHCQACQSCCNERAMEGLCGCGVVEAMNVATNLGSSFGSTLVKLAGGQLVSQLFPFTGPAYVCQRATIIAGEWCAGNHGCRARAAIDDVLAQCK